MCEAAHIIGFWENLMRNVCVYMKMSTHYWDVLWNWGLHCVSLLSRRNNRDTSDSFVIFLSQGAVLSLSVLISDWGTRAHWPPASVSISVLEEKQPTHCTVHLEKLFSKYWHTVLHCSSSSIRLNQFIRPSNAETASYFWWFGCLKCQCAVMLSHVLCCLITWLNIVTCILLTYLKGEVTG